MPTTYTHDRFGKDVLRHLPEEYRMKTEAECNLYWIGLQGPDIFFYYNPVFGGKLNRLGTRIHQQPGRCFFERASKVLSENEDPLHRAYVYGSICHFTLDAICHNFIFRHEMESGLPHAEIEGQFDRCLLVMDGKNPISENLAADVHPTRKYAEVIAAFYPGVTVSGIYRTLKQFVKVNRLLICRTAFKRNLLYGAMKAAGVYKKFQGHVISREPNPRAELANDRLMELYGIAIPKAAQLIAEFDDNAAGKRSWDSLYDLTYESVRTLPEDSNSEDDEE
ncbi:MAG: hypothetical protein K6E30_00060 [Lachnospiraceae bacterium]|nr:hypothetical protein [Lachnospiraceae bacterium]